MQIEEKHFATKNPIISQQDIKIKLKKVIALQLNEQLIIGYSIQKSDSKLHFNQFLKFLEVKQNYQQV
ncbi:unnamed protein product [Paramecium octaurelia]|uniref:Uncharacterized protein n=1 Tax=Paramecium octaurelia TaxID=43137 RepID=A0A8S1TZ30_PAROT|nr:unnamed protein product [Paramecium octaurelia]